VGLFMGEAPHQHWLATGIHSDIQSTSAGPRDEQRQ
jgi:hypothetical protein